VYRVLETALPDSRVKVWPPVFILAIAIRNNVALYGLRAA
jgi:hypothetical protein